MTVFTRRARSDTHRSIVGYRVVLFVRSRREAQGRADCFLRPEVPTMKGELLGLGIATGCVASFLTINCGAPQSRPSAAASASVSASAAKAPDLAAAPPRVCRGRQLIATLIGQQAERARDAAERKHDKAPESHPAATTVPEVHGGGSFQKAYEVVAPAAAVIQVKDGVGTGIVVDPGGLVLTNFHVVAHGMQRDFTIKVSLSFGHRAASGGMELDDKNYEGIVIKADPVRDIALVKVKDPPKNLAVIKISSVDPTPGQAVSSIGHAGIGMLWAMKTCHVAAVGEPAKNSIVAAKDCSTIDDPSARADENARHRAQCEKSKEEALNAMASFREGLFVQSDCQVAPGDSGGPLLNDQGELVGLNQSISADRSSVSATAYHIHVGEIREFVRVVPAEPAQITPDPWCDGGTETSLEDVDMDGKIDTVMAYTGQGMGMFAIRRFALLMDLDEDQAVREHTSGATNDGTRMPFDAEVALLSLPVGTYAWYDTNNNGAFDLLLADPEDKGHPTAAFDIGKDGRLVERKDFVAPFFFDVAFLPPNDVMHTHLGKIAQAVNRKLASAETLADAKATTVIPDPVSGIGRKGKLGDMDHDGRADTLVFQSAFGRGALIDADQDSLGVLDLKDDPEPLMRSGRLDVELSFIVQPASIWAIYDTNNDGKQDLALFAAPGSEDRIATAAWTKTGDSWTPTDEHVGLRAVRPALLNIRRAAVVANELFSFAASDEALGALPAAMPSVANYRFAERNKIANKAVVLGARHDYRYVLFDPDRDSKLGNETAGEAVRKAKFDADVASAMEEEFAWVFYDTDQDNKFDLVLYGNANTGVSTHAFRVDGSRLRSDPQVAKGRLYRYKNIFKQQRIGDAFRKLAKDLVPASALEE